MPLLPREEGRPFQPFRLDDPFGIRKAVVPLFWVDSDGNLEGQGTAFAIDSWGHFATADHVIAATRHKGRVARQSSAWHVSMPTDEGLAAILDVGLAFGTVPLPPDAISPVVAAWSPCFEGNDPLAALDGRMNVRPIDFALLTVKTRLRGMVTTLPMVSRPQGPRPGDVVAAIGFPEINTFQGDAEAASTIIEEGMFAAYGRVTALHGSGRDMSNPTPVFEVKTNWPPGMSGGPVFNARGEVIGIVSRSILPDVEGELGLGWATWLEPMSELPAWVPTLDTTNPCMRRGWAVLRNNPRHLASVEPTQAEAERTLATIVEPGYVVERGVWRLGTEDFISIGSQRD